MKLIFQAQHYDRDAQLIQNLSFIDFPSIIVFVQLKVARRELCKQFSVKLGSISQTYNLSEHKQ
ncbi:MAG: hypothetical protein ACI9XU_002023 [Arenicella sp.]|jgi:hypothetical protein